MKVLAFGAIGESVALHGRRRFVGSFPYFPCDGIGISLDCYSLKRKRRAV